MTSITSWNTNAQSWNDAMENGSLFQKVIVEPKTLEFLDVRQGMSILDIACGNGQMSRRLTELGATVVAIDGSSEMIRLAEQYPSLKKIVYKVADVIKSEDAAFLKQKSFDAVLCNMALMDIAEIKPVLELAYSVLKDAGVFVFSITHPCFDKAVGPHLKETHENQGTLDEVHAIKVERYLSQRSMHVKALPSLPSSHFFFHRPLQDYLNEAFSTGFSMNGVAEVAFPQESAISEHKGWHKLCEIPVVFIAKLRK